MSYTRSSYRFSSAEGSSSSSSSRLTRGGGGDDDDGGSSSFRYSRKSFNYEDSSRPGVSHNEEYSSIRSRPSLRLSSRYSTDNADLDIDTPTSRFSSSKYKSILGDDSDDLGSSSSRRYSRYSSRDDDAYDTRASARITQYSVTEDDDDFGVSSYSSRRQARISYLDDDDDDLTSTSRTSYSRRFVSDSFADDYKVTTPGIDDESKSLYSTYESRRFQRTDSNRSTGKESGKDAGQVYEAILDYKPPRSATDEICLKEGQQVIILSKDKPHKWKVRTRKTEKFPRVEEGFAPSAYLTSKNETVEVEVTDLTASPAAFTAASVSDSAKDEQVNLKDLKKKKDMIVKEIIETEEDLIRDMQFVQRTYIRQSESAITPKEIKAVKDRIFNCYKDLLEFHRDVLLKNFQTLSKEPTKIGTLFLRIDSDFDNHTKYCKNLPNALEVLEENSDVSEFFNNYAVKVRDEKTLADHLKMPLQRLSDYQLLLKELSKHLSRMDENVDDLEKAVKVIATISERDGATGDSSDATPSTSPAPPVGEAEKKSNETETDKPSKSPLDAEGGDKLSKMLKNVMRAKDYFDVTETDGKTNERFVFLFKSRMFITEINKNISESQRTYDVKRIVQLPEVEASFDDDISTAILIKAKSPSDRNFPIRLKAKTWDQAQTWLNLINSSSDLPEDNSEQNILDSSDLFTQPSGLKTDENNNKINNESRRDSTTAPLSEVSTESGALTGSDGSSSKTSACHANADILDESSNTEATTLPTDNLRTESLSSVDANVETPIQSKVHKDVLASSVASSSKLQILQPLRSTTRHVGETATLECEVSADTTNVQWLKDNKPLTGTNYTIRRSDTKHFLDVNSLTLDDMGMYTIVATNSKESVSSSSTLNVLTAPGDSRPTSPGGSFLPHPPKFKIRLKDTELLEGTTVRFEVIVRGLPIPNITFFKDDKPLKQDDHLKILFQSKEVFEIMIEHVKKEDAGVYKCVAVNLEGQDETSGRITVSSDKNVFWGLDENEPVTETSDSSSPRARSPPFKWFKDGQEFEASERFQVQFDDQEDNIVLIFQHVKPDDAGLYTCVASTSSGKISCSAELNVQGMVRELSREPVKPTFVKELSNIKVSEGESVAILEAQISGYPKPRLEWFKEDQLIKSSEKYKMLYEGEENYALLIKNVKDDDAGNYKLKATNELGYVESEAELTVVKKPKLTKMPDKIEVGENEKLVIQATYESVPKPEVKWSKDGVELKDSKRLKTAIKDDKIELVVEKATAEDEGKYQCMVSNELGKTVGDVDVAVRAPPRFLKKMEEVRIFEGETATFMVQVSNKPKVEFYKGSKLLVADKRIQIKEDGENFSLIINKAQEDDKDNYKCKIQNKYGMEEDGADLIINKREVAPDFKEKLQDVQAKVNDENVKLNVQIDGEPKPQCKWFHDGKEITDKDKDYKIINDDKGSTLIIPKVAEDHGGQYACQSENAAGKAETSSKLVVNGPPYVVKHLENTESAIDADVKLTAVIKGHPKPDIKWFVGDKEVTIDKRRKYSFDEASCEYTLTITKMEKIDFGDYRIEASNAYGKCQSTCKVEQVSKPLFVNGLKNVVAKEMESNIEMMVQLDKQTAKPLIKWLKDDKEVPQSDKNYKMVESKLDNSYKLVIMKATEEMVGKYRCIASNDFGSAETAARFDVITKPKFLKGLEDVSVLEGNNVSMTVKIAGFPKPNIAFYKDGQDVSTEATIVVKKEMDDIYVMEIENIRIIMSGEYECRIMNEAGEASSKGVITVQSKPTFIKDLTDQTVPVGSDIALEVVLTGSPSPQLKWFVNGKETKGEERILLESREELYKLIIPNAQDSNSGIYHCEASNDLAKATSNKAKVEVTKNEFPPKFTKKLEDTLVVVNDNVRFEVKISASPEAEVTWSKDGKPLKPSSTVMMKKEGDSYILILKDLQLADSGSITCKAENSKGFATDSAKLSVEEPTLPTISGLKDISVIDGEPVKIEAVVTGFPKPDVCWYRDGEPVDSELVTSDVKNNRYGLDFSAIGSRDVGKYTCVATNSAGEASEAFSIDIGGKKPFFIKELEESIVMSLGKQESGKLKLGQSAIFETIVDGIPTPEVTWLKNDEEMRPSQRVQITSDDNEHKMEIKEITKDDVAKYTCKAVNEYGEALSICLLKFLNEPHEPIIKKPLEDVKIEEGDTLNLICKVDGEPMPAVKWLKDDKPVEDDRLKVTSKGDGSTTMSIEKVELADTGKYEVRAENAKGVATSDAQVLVEKPQRPPKFTETLKDEVKVDYDAPLVLEASVFGLPTPEIQWFKDGKPLAKDARVKTSFDDGKDCKLVIDKAKSQDAGNYSIKATNPNGQAVSESNVKVMPEPFAPLVVDNLPVKVQVVTGDAIELHSKIEAYPQPDVTWLKDKVPLQESDRVKIVSSPTGEMSLTVLDAKPEDKGEYTVRAENPIGETGTSTKVDVVSPSFAEKITKSLPDNVEVEKQKPLVLTASVENASPGEVTWLKDGKPLKPEDGVKMTQKDEQFELKIENSQPTDSGTYALVVKTPTEKLQTQTNVQVVDQLGGKHVDEVVTVETTVETIDSDTAAKLAEAGELDSDTAGQLAQAGKLDTPTVAKLADDGKLDSTAAAKLAEDGKIDTPTAAKLAEDGKLDEPTIGKLAEDGKIDAATAARLASTGMLLEQAAAKLAEFGKLDQPTVAKLAQDGKIDTPTAAKLADEGKLDTPTAARLARDGKLDESTVAKLAEEGKLDEPTVAKLAKDVKITPDTAAKLAEEGKINEPTAAKLALDGKLDSPTVAKLLNEGLLDSDMAELAAVAKKAQEGRLDSYTAAKLAKEGKIETPTAAKLADDGKLDSLTAAKLAEDGKLDTPTAAKLAQDGRLNPTAAAALAQDKMLDSDTAAILAKDGKLDTPTVAKLAQDGKIDTPTAAQLARDGKVDPGTAAKLAEDGKLDTPAVAKLARDGKLDEPTVAKLAEDGLVDSMTAAKLARDGKIDSPTAEKLALDGKLDTPTAARLAREGIIDSDLVKLAAVANLAEEKMLDSYTVSKLAKEGKIEAPTATKLAEDGKIDTPTAAKLAEDGKLDTPAVAKLAQDGKLDTPTIAKLAEDGKIDSDTAAKLAEDGKLDQPTVAKLAEDGKIDTPTAAKLADEGKIDAATAAKLAEDGKIDSPTAAKLAAEDKIDSPTAAKLAVDGKLDKPTVAKLVREGTLDDEMVEVAAVAKLAQDGKLDSGTAAKLAEEGKLEPPVVAKLAEDGKLDQPTAAKLVQDGKIDTPTAAKLAEDGKLDQPTAAKLAQDGKLDSDTVAKLAKDGKLDTPTAAKLTEDGKIDAPTATILAEDGILDKPTVTKLANEGKINPDAAAKLAQDEKIEPDAAAKLALDGKLDSPTVNKLIRQGTLDEEQAEAAAVAKLAQDGKLDSGTAAKLAEEGKLEAPTVAKLAEDGRLDRATAAKLAEEGKLDSDTATKLAKDGKLDQQTIEKLAEDGKLDTPAVFSLAKSGRLDFETVAKLAEDGKIDTPTAAKLASDGKLDSDVAAKLAEDGKIDTAIANKLARDGVLDTPTVAKLADDGKIDSSTAAKLAQDGKIDSATAAKLALDGKLDGPTAKKLAREGTLDDGLVEVAAVAKLAQDGKLDSETAAKLAEDGKLDTKTAAKLASDGKLDSGTAAVLAADGKLDTETAAKLASDGKLDSDTANKLANSGVLDATTAANLVNDGKLHPDTVATLSELGKFKSPPVDSGLDRISDKGVEEPIQKKTAKDLQKAKSKSQDEDGRQKAKDDDAKPKEKPKFKNGLSPVEVESGHPCRIECQIDGNPADFNTSWYKDGEEILPNEHFGYVKEPNGTIALLIDSFSAKDVGEYQIRISQAGGPEATSSCKAMLKDESKSKPAFIDDLRVVSCDELGPLTLKAKLVPSTAPFECKWFFNGKELKESDSIKFLTFPDGTIMLQIDNCKQSDSGKYKVEVTNSYGKSISETTAKITPKATKMPVILKGLEPTTLIAGESGVIELKMDTPDGDIKFLHNGKQVLPTDRIHIQQLPDGTIKLVFDRVKLEDEGDYVFVFQNNDGQVKSASPVTVKSKPIITRQLSDRSIKDGCSTKFEVQIKGNPQPEITWYKNGLDLEVDSRHVTTLKGDDNCYLLILEKCNPRDDAEYSVSAVNDLGEATSAARLNVLSNDKFEDCKPEFVQPLQDVVGKPGDTITLRAKVKCHPVPEITWKKNGQAISSSDRIHFNFDGSNIELIITNAEAGDFGLYELTVANSLGEVSSSANVNTFENKAPKFVSRLSDMTRDVKTQTKLSCRVEGFPDPGITWTFNGKVLEPGLRYCLFSEMGEQILIVSNPAESDSGVYECIAKNTLGSDKTSANINFVEKDKAGEAAQFLTKLTDYDVLPGGVAKFSACVIGSPKPELKWFIDGKEIRIDGGKYFVDYQDNGMIKFEVRNVTEADCGKYRCHASNVYGYDNSIAELNFETVSGLDRSKQSHKSLKSQRRAMDAADDIEYKTTGLPVPLPDMPKITKMTDSSLTLLWLPSVPQQPRFPVSYVVEFAKMDDGIWVVYQSNIKDTKCDVNDLEKFQDYSFRIRVENKFGVSDPSPSVTAYRSKLKSAEREAKEFKPDEFDITHKPREQIAAAPKFLREEQSSMYGVCGQPVTIEFWVYGYPEPNITWLFNDEKIEHGDKYNFMQDRGGKMCLFINRMNLSDIGTYTCVAKNEHGEERRSIRLMNAEPPVFTKRLEEITVASRNHVRLECNVKGIPEPTIKWFKDFQPIHDTSRINVLWESPDHATLIISDTITRDMGLYSCTATNVAGSTTTAAFVHVKETEVSYEKYPFSYNKTIKPKNKSIEQYFDIGDELGRGTQGITYHSVERNTGKSYAAKMMHGMGETRAYMMSELDIMNQLGTHEKLVQLHDAFASTPHALSLVMDLCGGGPLLDFVLKKGSLTENEVAHYIKQILEGLHYMNFKNIGHFGLTIGDILMERINGPDIKICDFGLAQRVIPGTTHYVEFGHPEFVAPEIVGKNSVTFSSDVWSVGVITYILLTGISPFLSENDRATLTNIQNKSLNLQENVEHVSDSGKDFLRKVLDFDPNSRLDVKGALNHPWLKNATHPEGGSKLNIMDKLHNYNYSYKKWYENASCKRYYRRRALHSCYTHPSRMIYPPDESYSPLMSPEREMKKYNKTISPFDNVYAPNQMPDSENFSSESHYQSGPDTYLLQLRDTDFPARIRRYLRIAATSSPSIASNLKQAHWGGNPMASCMKGHVHQVSIKERRKFTDVMDEEIGDEIRGLTSRNRPTRLIREVGTSSYAMGQMNTLRREAKLRSEPPEDINYTMPFFREKLKNLAFKAGDDVYFSCYAVGNPSPTYTWFRNDTILIESSRVEVKKCDDGRCELRIKPGREYDLGVFKCVARNCQGSVVCRARLSLGSVPAHLNPPTIKDGSAHDVLLAWASPKFDVGNSDILHFKLEYKTVDSDDWLVANAGIKEEFYLMSGLEPNTSYQFRISAYNKFGWSEASPPSEVAKTVPVEENKAIALPPGMQFVCSSSSIKEDGEEERIDYSQESNPVPLIKSEFKDLYDFKSVIANGTFSVIAQTYIKDGSRLTLATKCVLIQSEKESSMMNEYEIMKSLSHEKIAKLCYASRDSNLFTLAIEMLSGLNVLTYLSRKQFYTEECVSQIVCQVLDAIEYLHFREIGLLELQPDNVLVVDDRHLQIKLTDFASARHISSKGNKVSLTANPEYTAPELIRNEDVTLPYTDIWTVGVLTYILLSGHSPFRGEDAKETAQNVVFVRYLFDRLYPQVTQEAIRFLLTVFKLTPHKRPTIEECFDSKWLIPNDFMIRKREMATFDTNKLSAFSNEFFAKKSASHARLLDLIGLKE